MRCMAPVAGRVGSRKARRNQVHRYANPHGSAFLIGVRKADSETALYLETSMSAKSTGASAPLQSILHSFNEAIGGLKTAHDAIGWCTHLFRTIYEKSGFEPLDTAVVLKARLAETHRAAGIGRYLSMEFETLIGEKLAEAEARAASTPPEGGTRDTGDV